ncbi:MAG: hypothetical protein ACLQUY_05145 [Ktedonobacterales bacterium]
MPKDTPDPSRVEDELEVTDLHPRRRRARGVTRLPGLPIRAGQRLILGLGLVLLVAVLLAGSLSGGAVWRGLARAPEAPTSTEVAIPTEAVSVSLPPPPGATQLGSSGGALLSPAPASCSGTPPALTDVGPLGWAEAIGRAPVLVDGFIGPSATLTLGPAASANAYGWTAPYSLYGWPAPIILLVHSGVTGPVTLSGWDVRTGYPLWFGLVVAGEWGAPQHIVPTLGLDPAHPAIPAGGWTGMEQFWWGYAFLPGAGCYTLAASWPGGSWRITVSAGAVSTGH